MNNNSIYIHDDIHSNNDINIIIVDFDFDNIDFGDNKIFKTLVLMKKMSFNHVLFGAIVK